MGKLLTRDGAERLAYAIVRRAYEDYYISCVMPKKLPNRPKVLHIVKGKKTKEIATDHEYHVWLVGRLKSRQWMRDDAERFIWSKWYDTLVNLDPDGKTERVNRILNELEYRRKNGLPMFGDGTETEDEEWLSQFGER